MQLSCVDIPVMRNFSRYYLRFALACCFAVIAACSSAPETNAQAQGAFTLLERSGGLRLFEYTLRIAPAPLRPIRRSVDGTTTAPPRQPDDRAMLRQAHRLLADDPRLLDYCPNGYMTLDEYALLGELKIRGECRYEPRSAASE